jgi:hypothetical protein
MLSINIYIHKECLTRTRYAFPRVSFQTFNAQFIAKNPAMFLTNDWVNLDDLRSFLRGKGILPGEIMYQGMYDTSTCPYVNNEQ